MGIIDLALCILSVIFLLLAICITISRKRKKDDNISSRIRNHKSTIRISEADYSADKIKELDIMLANYGYFFDITEMMPNGNIVHVYRRK